MAVTGATGTLGRELVGQLAARGADIRVIVRDRGRMSALYDHVGKDIALDIVETELTNPVELREALAGMDIVFHCAARVSFRFDETEEIVRVNTDVTRHVVDACLGAGVGKLVHVSSIASLSPRAEKGKFIDETCFPDSVTGWNGYSMSKYYSENEVWWGIRQGLKAVIVNPSVILGPGAWDGYGSAALFARLSKGMPFYTDGVTGYVDVRDVAAAMIALSMTPSAEGGRFILSAENLSYGEFIAKVARVSGRRPPRIRAGRRALAAAGAVERALSRIVGREPLLTKGIIKTALTKSCYTSDAVKRISGFGFRPMDETIAFMAEEYAKWKRQ